MRRRLKRQMLFAAILLGLSLVALAGMVVRAAGRLLPTRSVRGIGWSALVRSREPAV
jgi:hypothetical protein